MAIMAVFRARIEFTKSHWRKPLGGDTGGYRKTWLGMLDLRSDNKWI
jgi:hypothetical protein